MEEARSQLAERDRAKGEREAKFAERERGLKSQAAKQHLAWLDATKQTGELEIKLRAAEGEIKKLKSEIKYLRSQPKARNLKALEEAADLLNHLKARRKKSKADLGDVEAILEMLEGCCDE